MSRKKLKEDIEIIKNKFQNTPITGIKWEDESLSFHFTPLIGDAQEFNIVPGDDYPDNVMVCEPNTDPKFVNDSLPSILGSITKSYCKKFNMDIPKVLEEISSERSELKKSKDIKRKELMMSAGSVGSFDSEDEDYDEYSHAEEEFVLNEELVRDMDNVKMVFGRDSITTRVFKTIETIDVELHIDVSFISDTTCDAWGIERYLPLVVRLPALSTSSYRNAPPPSKVEVFQPEMERCGIATQLGHILTMFISDHWKKNPNSVNKSSKNPLSKNNNSNTKNTVRDEDIAKLVDMGFPFHAALRACQATKTLEDAMNMLLIGGTAETEVKVPSVADGKNPKKRIPSDEYGFLVQIAEYARLRIPTLPDFCVICDNAHVFASGMIKPTVCTRELCCFAFQQLGVMSDAAEDIATEAEIVDLLVCMATAAAKSTRRELVFDPFPTVVHPSRPKEFVLHENKKDFALAEKILSSFPSVQEMTQAESSISLKQYMDAANPYAYSLLQWIINSNRSHLVKLPKEKRIKSLGTPHQYLLLSAPPEKEEKFAKLKKQYGSVFAFHGSPVENWHSILRNGLKNASGTKFMLNGAAYGNGIYISPHSGTSFGYSGIGAYNYNNKNTGKQSSSVNQFVGTSSFHCLALCELINKDISKNGTIWVCPSEDYVVTRFFFVYTGRGDEGGANCSTESEAFNQEILNAMKREKSSKYK